MDLKNPNRLMVLGVSIGIGVLFVGLLTLVMNPSGRMAEIFLDRQSVIFLYPFTIQNIMHIIFFIGLGELLLRWQVSKRENSFLLRGFLPEDDETVLQAEDLGAIRKQVKGEFDEENGFLPYLIDISILQFHSTRSIDQVVSVLNSTLELFAHRLDLRYSMIRYVVWVIPTIGFIGTVIGIASTLSMINPQKPDLKLVTTSLAVAFNTTLVALILSAILVFILHLVQNKEEGSLNSAGNYCLKNLANRMYVGKK